MNTSEAILALVVVGVAGLGYYLYKKGKLSFTRKESPVVPRESPPLPQREPAELWRRSQLVPVVRPVVLV